MFLFPLLVLVSEDTLESRFDPSETCVFILILAFKIEQIKFILIQITLTFLISVFINSLPLVVSGNIRHVLWEVGLGVVVTGLGGIGRVFGSLEAEGKFG